MIEPPASGRRFTIRRTPGLGDVDPGGHLRLDALARLLQDVASADSEDSGIDPAWVVRRTAVLAERWPRLGERLELTTFCSGVGPRWAERRTRLSASGGAGGRTTVDTVALWVHVDEAGRPARLNPTFHRIYGEAAGGRVVRAKLTHAAPPPDVQWRAWMLRYSDLDIMGHVNNAAAWEAVVDEAARWLPGRRIGWAEVEHPGPLDPGEAVLLGSVVEGDRLRTWLVVDGEVRVSAVVGVGPAVAGVGRAVRSDLDGS